jgi:hypothetical protein
MRRVPVFFIFLATACCFSMSACSSHGSAGSATPIGQPPASVHFAGPAVHQPLLYVANYGGDSITEYNFADNGDPTPLRQIQGSNTLIRRITDLAVDSNGAIYVSNACELIYDPTVDVYAPLADGDVAPIRVLDRPHHACESGMWVDSAGYLYLGEYKLHDVPVFAPGASGNDQPVRLIGGSNTGFLCPWGVTTDAAGDLFVADKCAKAILEFAPGANGNVAPIAKIAGSRTQLHAPVGVKLGADGKVYVIDYTTGTITAFPAGANGNVAPVATLSPPNGDSFIGVVATSGSKLVVGLDGVPTTTWGVATYKIGSTIVPLRTIAGPNTALDGPVAEAVH